MCTSGVPWLDAAVAWIRLRITLRGPAEDLEMLARGLGAPPLGIAVQEQHEAPSFAVEPKNNGEDALIPPL